MEKYFPIKKAVTSIVGDGYLKATKNNNEYHLFLNPTIFTDFLTEEKANNLYALKDESSGDSSIDLSPYVKKTELDPYLTEEEGDNKYKLKTENVDLSPYIKTEEANSTFAKKSELEPYLTEDEANNKYALKGESSEIDLPDLEDYAKKSDLDIYIEESRADNKYALKSDIDTTLTSETLQESLSDYELTSAVDNKISNLKTEIQENYYKKDDDLNVDLTDYLTKNQADTTYQKKSDMGDYVTKSEIPEGGITEEQVRQIINEIIEPLRTNINDAQSDARIARGQISAIENNIDTLFEKTGSIETLEDDINRVERSATTNNAMIKETNENLQSLQARVLALEYAVKRLT